jgi:mRNA interferase MazF
MDELPEDYEELREKLKYSLGLSSEPTDEWLRENASPELFKKFYGYLSDSEKITLLKNLLKDLKSVRG